MLLSALRVGIRPLGSVQRCGYSALGRPRILLLGERLELGVLGDLVFGCEFGRHRSFLFAPGNQRSIKLILAFFLRVFNMMAVSKSQRIL